MKLLPEVIPHTLRWYVENYPEELPGKIFDYWDWVYTVDNLSCDVGTKHLILDTMCCDVGDMGLSDVEKIDLYYDQKLLDKEELIEGVNAERICPLTYYRSSI